MHAVLTALQTRFPTLDPTVYRLAVEEPAFLPLTKYLAHLERVREGKEATSNDVSTAEIFLRKVGALADGDDSNCLKHTQIVLHDLTSRFPGGRPASEPFFKVFERGGRLHRVSRNVSLRLLLYLIQVLHAVARGRRQ